jgi:hypothetical protein
VVGDILYTQGGREVHTGFWWGNLKKRGHYESLQIKRRKISKHILKKLDWAGGGGMKTGLIWLSTGTSGTFSVW